MVLLLAVDSGGSKCEAICVDTSGNLLGRAHRDFRTVTGARFIGGLGRSERLVAETIRAALPAPLDVSELHVCGPLPDKLVPELGQVQSIAHHVVKEQDGPLALAGTRSGIVVLAGTGAFAYGRRQDGQEIHFDGIGPLYGDYGSGFQIGLAGIRAAGRSSWSRRYETALAGPILEACREQSGMGSELCDVIIDNCVPYGDAAVSIEGLEQKVGPLSTVTGCAIVNELVVSVVRNLVERGVEPPVFVSANIDGGDERNARLLAENRHRIHYME